MRNISGFFQSGRLDRFRGGDSLGPGAVSDGHSQGVRHHLGGCLPVGCTAHPYDHPDRGGGRL